MIRSYAAATVFALTFGGSLAPGLADEIATYVLTLENDTFTPSDLKIPADKPFALKVVNKEKAAVEIEAKDLKIEKVVAAGGEVIARVKAQKPGRYLLVNEYKEDTVKTFVVVE
jgi:hypothetical protein